MRRTETFWWYHFERGYCEWLGYRVEMDGLTFFIARSYGDAPESRDWYVTEARSGYSSCAGGATISEALRNIRASVTKHGREKYLRSIRKAIRENGESPWRAAEKARRRAA